MNETDWKAEAVRLEAERNAALLQNRALEKRIYDLGLLCDSVSGLENGFCQDVGEPRDNVTRIGLALKHLGETNRLKSEMEEQINTLKNALAFVHEGLCRRECDAANNSHCYDCEEATRMVLAKPEKRVASGLKCGFWVADLPPCENVEPCPKHGTMRTNRY